MRESARCGGRSLSVGMTQTDGAVLWSEMREPLPVGRLVELDAEPSGIRTYATTELGIVLANARGKHQGV